MTGAPGFMSCHVTAGAPGFVTELLGFMYLKLVDWQSIKELVGDMEGVSCM